MDQIILDNLLQLPQTLYYGREEEEKRQKKRKAEKDIREDCKAGALRSILKQPEKNTHRDPGRKEHVKFSWFADSVTKIWGKVS